VAVNLDPHHVQTGITWLDMAALGLRDDEAFEVHDLFAGGTYRWHGPDNYVHLDPHISPAHVFSVHTHSTERDHELTR
jgi:starch synthase (maltosyl-transferring)